MIVLFFYTPWKLIGLPEGHRGRRLVNTDMWRSLFERCAHYSSDHHLEKLYLLMEWGAGWGGGTVGMVSSPQSWACWPSLWPFPWVGSRHCSERRRTRWAPRTQTRSRSRSRRLAPWWLTLEGGRSGRSPSAWSWSAQSWSLSREDAKKKSEVLRGTRGITLRQPLVNLFRNLSLTLWNS